MSFDDSGPCPSVDFEYPTEDGIEQIEAAALAHYRQGALNAVRGLVGLLDDSRSAKTTACRVAVLRSVLENGHESIPEIAHRLGVKPSYVYRLARDVREFLRIL